MIPRQMRLLPLIAAAMLLPYTTVAAAPCPAILAAEAQAALAAVNKLRADAGRGAVTADSRLAAVAGAQACAMAQTATVGHSDGGRGAGKPLRRAGYDWRFAAENVGGGIMDLRRVMGAWMGSPKHRANLLDPRATQFGIGVATGSDPRMRYWSMVVATPR